MTFEALLDQLKHPNPAQRLQALRILAMVEETRAVNTMLEIYKTDADPQVREVAKWAGSLVWKAAQNGYDSEAAIRAFFEGGRKNYAQEALLDRLSLEASPKDKQHHEEVMSRMVRDHSEALSGRYNTTAPAVVPAFTKMDAQAFMEPSNAAPSQDDLDLLDAGLRHLFL